MDKCTQNYECIVIDNSTRSNNIEEQVFGIKRIYIKNTKWDIQVFGDITIKSIIRL